MIYLINIANDNFFQISKLFWSVMNLKILKNENHELFKFKMFSMGEKIYPNDK
jgi:hypothetical protein